MIRSFIAFEIPESIRREIARTMRQMATHWPEYRWVDTDQLHLTMNFLGDVPDEKITDVCQVLRKVVPAFDAFSFTLSGLGAFPKAKRPRVLWLGVTEGASQLSKLYYQLADDLEHLRLERDRKAFRPHVTLARIRDRQRWSDSIVEKVERNDPLEMGVVDANQLVLYSSHMEKAGPVYTPMDRVGLG